MNISFVHWRTLGKERRGIHRDGFFCFTVMACLSFPIVSVISQWRTVFLRGCSIVGGKAAMPWMIYCSEVLGIELEKLVFRTASVLPYLSLPIQGLQWPLSGRWTWCRVTARVSGQPFHLLQDACSNFHLFTILWTGFEHGGHPERGGQHHSNFYCQETSGLLTLSLLIRFGCHLVEKILLHVYLSNQIVNSGFGCMRIFWSGSVVLG